MGFPIKMTQLVTTKLSIEMLVFQGTQLQSRMRNTWNTWWTFMDEFQFRQSPGISWITLRIPGQGPGPMERWFLNLYETQGFLSPQNCHFWGFRILRVIRKTWNFTVTEMWRYWRHFKGFKFPRVTTRKGPSFRIFLVGNPGIWKFLKPTYLPPDWIFWVGFWLLIPPQTIQETEKNSPNALVEGSSGQTSLQRNFAGKIKKHDIIPMMKLC